MVGGSPAGSRLVSAYLLGADSERPPAECVLLTHFGHPHQKGILIWMTPSGVPWGIDLRHVDLRRFGDR